LGVPMLDDLVYCNYNLKLAARFKKNKLLIESGSKKYDAIYVEAFNEQSEWVTGTGGPCNEFVYGEEGLTWAEVEEATGATDLPGPSTRARRLPLPQAPQPEPQPESPEPEAPQAQPEAAEPQAPQAQPDDPQPQFKAPRPRDEGPWARLYRRKKTKNNE